MYNFLHNFAAFLSCEFFSPSHHFLYYSINSHDLLPMSGLDNIERYAQDVLSTAIIDKCINIINGKYSFYLLGFIDHQSVYFTSSCATYTYCVFVR